MPSCCLQKGGVAVQDVAGGAGGGDRASKILEKGGSQGFLQRVIRNPVTTPWNMWARENPPVSRHRDNPTTSGARGCLEAGGKNLYGRRLVWISGEPGQMFPVIWSERGEGA